MSDILQRVIRSATFSGTKFYLCSRIYRHSMASACSSQCYADLISMTVVSWAHEQKWRLLSFCLSSSRKTDLSTTGAEWTSQTLFYVETPSHEQAVFGQRYPMKRLSFRARAQRWIMTQTMRFARACLRLILRSRAIIISVDDIRRIAFSTPVSYRS